MRVLSVKNLPIGYTNDETFVRAEIKGYANFADPFIGLLLTGPIPALIRLIHL